MVATIVVGFVVSLGIPNLLRSRMSLHQFKTASRPDRGRFAGYMEAREGGSGQRVMALGLIAPSESDRKMIRTASMDLVVKRPVEIADKIRVLTEQAGGFLVSSETNGGENASSASLTIRVPTGKFEEVRAQIANLGVQIQSEKLEAEDVTKQYVDLSARLRNYRAQETQYLGILKQAKNVKDIVDVSEKLNGVRLEIEQQQAEFDALSKQIETVALTITLRAEADTQVFGLRWRPLYQLKVAARDGLDGVGEYAAAMAAFIFYIPTILLWLATIVFIVVIVWRIFRRVRLVLAKGKAT